MSINELISFAIESCYEKEDFPEERYNKIFVIIYCRLII